MPNPGGGGCFGISDTAISSTTLSTVPATKTWCVAVATASGVGSASPARVMLAIAPNSATPTALPTDRPNRFVAVTTPRSAQPTLACAAISIGLATNPIPSPTTKQHTATCQIADDPVSRMVDDVPSTTMQAPISAVLRNPIRRNTRPALLAAIGQPMVSVASARPATSGPAPSDCCA